MLAAAGNAVGIRRCGVVGAGTGRGAGLRAAPLGCTGSECVVNPTVGKTEVPSTGRVTGTGISVPKMGGVAVTRVGGLAHAMVGGLGITEDWGVLITGEVDSGSFESWCLCS